MEKVKAKKTSGQHLKDESIAKDICWHAESKGYDDI
jgi:hypothetical protein